MANPQDDFIKTALRLPRNLHADIQVAADDAGRSMNAEIIERLKSSLVIPPDISLACAAFGDVEDRLDFAVKVFTKAGLNVRIPDDHEM